MPEKPSAAIRDATGPACSSPISISKSPAGRSTAGAPATIRRITARPSGPPSSAARGSCRETSGGSEAITALGR